MTSKRKLCVKTWFSGRPNDRPFIERTADIHGYLHDRFDFEALGIELTNEAPDYCVVLNRLNEEFDFDRRKVIGVVTEPSWSNNIDYEFLEEKCSRVLSHFAFPFSNAVRGRCLAIPWVTRRPPPAPEEKSCKLSIIASPLRVNRAHTNYEFRHALVRAILSSKVECDIFGEWPGSDSRLKGPVEHKEDALMPYEFSVAIENTCEPGYITEKFIDCLLCGTTPVYLGDPLVRNQFKEGSSVRLLPSPIETLRAISRGEISRDVDAVELVRTSYVQTWSLFSQLKRVIDEMERNPTSETAVHNA